jgi:DNA-directed RNA polymerase subunit RPC12/RpoP
MNIIQLLKDVFLPKQEEKKPVAGEEEKKAEKQGNIPAGKGNYTEIIEGLISAAGYRDYTPVGYPEPVCPSCGNKLEEFPQRKTRCPSCKEEIFVRTRESDKQKVLLNSGQLDEFERQRNLDSGRYDTKMKNLAEKLEKYSEAGGWIFLSVLDDKDTREFAEFHGAAIKSGSEDEISALKLIIRPDSRVRTKTWFNDPEKDTGLKEYEQQKKEWFDKHK